MDNPYILQLSTFAATAWFQHRIKEQTGELEPGLRTVEQLAVGPYPSALLAGSEYLLHRRTLLRSSSGSSQVCRPKFGQL